MPALTIPNSFTAGTLIQAAQMNANFTAITTLLNTTLLDDTNIQNAGITRATKLKLGTANHVIINDGTGAMSSEALLALSRGGTGTALAFTTGDGGKVLTVNSAENAFELRASGGTSGALYLFSNFT